MGQWVGSGESTKNLINLDLIEIIQFSLNIYDSLDILDIFFGHFTLTTSAPYGAIFEYVATGPFAELLSADCPDVEKVPKFL